MVRRNAEQEHDEPYPGHGDAGPAARADQVGECRNADRRARQTVVADLDRALLRGRCFFPYFMLIAFEAGGYARAVLLLLATPLIWLLRSLVSDAAGVKLMIFVSVAGLTERKIKLASRAVLPRFFAEDVDPETLRVFKSFARRCVVTACPRLMVEVFAKEYLLADEVLGTEFNLTKGGRATGFVKIPGLLIGENRAGALSRQLGDQVAHVGLCELDCNSTRMCNGGCSVEHGNRQVATRELLAKPIVFHDGRLVRRPTAAVSLLTLAYMPFGFLLALVRIAFGVLLPTSLAIHALRALGVNIVVKGNPRTMPGLNGEASGVLYVCSHRTLLDPVMISFALGRPVPAVTYSISRVCELISPIKTVPLSRDREVDASMIRKLLAEGDLAMCPEGTTCREPFLLRYSSLFAELTDQIVPVAISNKMTMFHGTTATGWKGLDPFYFFMDPSPTYELTFLSQLPTHLTCAGGKTSNEVANYIQRLVAGTLGFECTNFTRKDKYRVLAGHNGEFPVRTL